MVVGVVVEKSGCWSGIGVLSGAYDVLGERFVSAHGHEKARRVLAGRAGTGWLLVPPLREDLENPVK